jgi:hypothetical protein
VPYDIVYACGAIRCEIARDAICARADFPNSQVCRAANGNCDIAEYCTGSTPACPADVAQPSTHACRPNVTFCDITEVRAACGCADVVRRSTVMACLVDRRTTVLPTRSRRECDGARAISLERRM